MLSAGNRLSQLNNHQLLNDIKHRLQNENTIGRHQVNKNHDVQKNHQVTAFAAPGVSSGNFEELSLMMQGRIKSLSKSLSSRRIANNNVEHLGDPDEQEKRVTDIHKLRKTYGQLDSSYDSDHLKKHAKYLFELAREGESFSFTDSSLPAASYIQLKEAENIAIENNEEKAKENIQKKLAELDSDENYSRKIDAGLNTAEIFSGTFNNDTDKAKARNFYYDHIMVAEDLGATLQALGDFKGWPKLGETIDTMSAAVRADMNASKTSTDPKLLVTKMQDLQRINTLISFAGDCTEFKNNLISQEIMHA